MDELKKKLNELKDQADEKLHKDSWGINEPELDQILLLLDALFEANIKYQEMYDVKKLRKNNNDGATIIALKNETDEKGKKIWTDTTAQAKISKDNEMIDIDLLSDKYLVKVIENKIKLLNEKFLLGKKTLSK